jgi:hypothetical protein
MRVDFFLNIPFTSFLIWACAATEYGQLREKNVEGVSFCVAGLEHRQFSFECHREDSSLSLSLSLPSLVGWGSGWGYVVPVIWDLL